jgi:Cys-rich repeat protein
MTGESGTATVSLPRPRPVFCVAGPGGPSNADARQGEFLAMDTKTFDALTRRFGKQRNRRDAVKAFAAGLAGLGIGRDAAAQVSAERSNCGQPCEGSSNNCNAGLVCSRTSGSGGICVRKPDSRNTCDRNINCSDNFELCRNGRCINQSNCAQCEVTADCPSGEVCRNGRCGECTRDQQCPAREVCRNGRCERGRNNDCRNNSDCPRRRRCRNGRCVRRN